MGQPPSLREQLRRCTVQLLVPKKSLGTGFFVAPGLILTCAHVVQIAQENNTPIEVSAWDGRAIGPGSIQKFVVEKIPARENLPGQKIQYLYPDLALLQVKLMDRPCVYLDKQVSSGDLLYTYGYPDNYPGGDEVEFAFEGESRIDQQRYLLKFKSGEARPGFSGAPLLNLSTGGVCGVVQTTRGSDQGGRAIPVSIVFQEFPELPAPQEAEGTIEVFYSYAEEDEKLAKALQKQLAILKRLGVINEWHPGKVVPNEEPGEQVIKHLNAARIILLLVSPDFMYSEQHGNVEVKLAMERSKAGGVVIPVNLRRIDYWEATPFGKLLAIPRNGTPVTEWGNRDSAFAEVAKEIRRAVESLRKKANP